MLKNSIDKTYTCPMESVLSLRNILYKSRKFYQKQCCQYNTDIWGMSVSFSRYKIENIRQLKILLSRLVHGTGSRKRKLIFFLIVGTALTHLRLPKMLSPKQSVYGDVINVNPRWDMRHVSSGFYVG